MSDATTHEYLITWTKREEVLRWGPYGARRKEISAWRTPVVIIDGYSTLDDAPAIIAIAELSSVDDAPSVVILQVADTDGNVIKSVCLL